MNRVCLSVIWFTISILHHPHAIGAQPNSEVKALKAFKDTVTDDPHGALTWDTDLESPCTWDHITCDNESSVVEVYVTQFDITGHLVPELGNLKKLQYLELNGNNLNGTIPAELGNLKDLRSLDLYDNRLTGPIPDTLANVPNLTFLRLQNNNLSGCIPLGAVIPVGERGILNLTGNPGLQWSC